MAGERSVLLNQTQGWRQLQEHKASVISSLHLKDLLNDSKRTDGLTFNHNGVYIDFSRQNATLETLQV